jgi:hypothetical protein
VLNGDGSIAVGKYDPKACLERARDRLGPVVGARHGLMDCGLGGRRAVHLAYFGAASAKSSTTRNISIARWR